MVEKSTEEILKQICGENNVFPAKDKNSPFYGNSVVIPSNVNQLQSIVKLAGERFFNIIPLGKNSDIYRPFSIKKDKSVLIIMEKFDKIKSISSDNMTAVVEAGVKTIDFIHETEKQKLFFPVTPSSKTNCTIGGNIASNAYGYNIWKYGKISKYLLGAKIILPDGEIMTVGSKTLKNVVGYNIHKLLCGSRGKTGIITEAYLKLLPMPEEKLGIIIGFPDFSSALFMAEILIENKLYPDVLTAKNNFWINKIQDYVDIDLKEIGSSFLFVQINGSRIHIHKQYNIIRKLIQNHNITRLVLFDHDAHYKFFDYLLNDVTMRFVENENGLLSIKSKLPRKNLKDFQDNVRILGKEFGHNILQEADYSAGIHNMFFYFENDIRGMADYLASCINKIVETLEISKGHIISEGSLGIHKKNFTKIKIDENENEILRKIYSIFDKKELIMGKTKYFTNHKK